VVVSLALLALCARAQAQFQLLESQTSASLRGIDAVSAQIAWASGSGGTVLLTTDGGATWKHCATPAGAEKLDFRGVQGFDEKTALVMASGPGASSALYKTTDRCATWQLAFANPDQDGFFDTLRMDRDEHRVGYLLGDPVAGRFVVFVTLDGGLHWSRVTASGLAAPAGAGAFAASNTALDLLDSRFRFATGGPNGAFFYSSELTCTALETPVLCLTESTAVEAVRLPLASGTAAGAFSILGTVAVGGDYSRPDDRAGTAAYFDPYFGGWFAAKTLPGGYRSAVAVDRIHDRLIAVGPNGTDVSRDGGKNWCPLRPRPADAPDADKNWNAISLPFVVGAKGRIGRLREAARAR
jgi:photosystem II stability/assembly factor-like uncharacterized protein